MPVRSSQPGCAGARVLIVGDDASVTHEFSRLLRLAGCEVWAAASMHTGLPLALSHAPDALVVDLRSPLPVSIGFGTAVRALPGLARLPIAIVTGDFAHQAAADPHPPTMTVYYRPLWLSERVELAKHLLTVPAEP